VKTAVVGWLLLAVAAASLASGLLSISTLEAIPLCLIRAWTDLLCPGCGMGHSLLAAMQGRLTESFGFHPLGPLTLAVWTFTAVGGILSPERTKERLRLLASGPQAAMIVSVFLAVWAVRL